MYSLLVILEVIISILLIIVVLMQSSKGGGLAGAFGGSTMGTVFGVRRTADFLGKTTNTLAALFIILALITNIFFLPEATTNRESIIQSSTPTSVPPPAVPRSAPAATPQEQGK
jgi:preprotein translocase subunit SecG